MLRLLIEHGANVGLVADIGATAYTLAVESGSALGDQLAAELKQLGACN